MRPILLQGHERPLTQLKYNREGDLLFSVARDKTICVWYSHNGERLGTLEGSGGANFSVDADPTTTIVATGSADQTARLWDLKTGKNIHSWSFKTTVKRVEFSPDGSKLIVLSEKMMGYPGGISVFNVTADVNATFDTEAVLDIKPQEGAEKFSFAVWSYGGKYIITAHADGSLSKYDGATGEFLGATQIHEERSPITDLQPSPDKTYVISSSKDKTARLTDIDSLKLLKTYKTDTSMNSACITNVKDFVILGGGQDAKDVTTTSSRDGKFEARFYHKIFEDEVGRVKGHFGPLNCVVAHPNGGSYASGGEEGYIRIHHFDPSYFDFSYDVERFAAKE